MNQRSKRAFERLVLDKLDHILDLLTIDYVKETVQMAWIDDMRASVAENTSVTQGAVVAMNKLADKLQEIVNSGSDPVELQSFVDTLRNDDAALAAAIAQHTPAEVEPAPAPVEPEVLPEPEPFPEEPAPEAEETEPEV